MKPDKFVTIAEYTREDLANIDLEELDEAGIQAVIQGANTLSIMPNLAMTGATMQLQVRASEEQKARKILQRKKK
jgi:hypothetical protein